jgi:hypothetical protein
MQVHIKNETKTSEQLGRTEKQALFVTSPDDVVSVKDIEIHEITLMEGAFEGAFEAVVNGMRLRMPFVESELEEFPPELAYQLKCKVYDSLKDLIAQMECRNDLLI